VETTLLKVCIGCLVECCKIGLNCQKLESSNGCNRGAFISHKKEPDKARARSLCLSSVTCLVSQLREQKDCLSTTGLDSFQIVDLTNSERKKFRDKSP
jgi:hypothetical protein